MALPKLMLFFDQLVDALDDLLIVHADPLATLGVRRAGALACQFERQLVDIAPVPVLARLERLDQRMADLVEVGRRVPVG
jgi:hypothetical protein